MFHIISIKRLKSGHLLRSPGTGIFENILGSNQRYIQNIWHLPTLVISKTVANDLKITDPNLVPTGSDPKGAGDIAT